jgi:TonB-linked SusC/RagA family outer membrane protein
MQSKEVEIGSSGIVTVSLKSNMTVLNDVVVVGYGTRRRSEVTSAISSVSERDIKNLPVPGADQMLQGKVAGVAVTSNSGQPGGGVSIRVRGITSVNGSEPLYVIDGVPILTNTSSTPQDQLGGQAGQSSQSVLATINPSDIASIDILKDASAQAIYGSLAANGVVLINTKKGKNGEGKLTYDVYYGWQNVPKKLDVMNLREYAQYYNSLVPDIRSVGGTIDTIGEFKNPSILGKGTDWQDALFQIGQIQNHQLSFSGGQGKTSYYFSGNYYDQTGTVIGSGFKRYALRFNIDQQVKSWLRAGISSNLSRTDQKITFTDGTDAVTNIVLFNSPATPVRNAAGEFITTSSIGDIAFGNGSNPIATAFLRDVNAKQSKAFGNIYADIQFTNWLSFRNEVGYDFQLNNNTAFQPYITNDANQVILSPSKIREDRNNSLYYVLRNYLTVNKSFGQHNLNVVFGHEAMSSRYDNQYTTANNLNLNIESTNAGTIDPANSGGGHGSFGMESYFGRANYTYANKYSLSASIRRDGSSNFGENNKYGYFPAVSAGWTITNEEFAKDLKVLNYLKFRVGVGSVGNQNSPVSNAYSTNIRLFSTAPFGPGGIPANVGNPNLSWESVVTYNAGADASILNRRIEITVDVYKKVTTNMILSSTLPIFAGLDPTPPSQSYREIEPPVTNAGKMTNSGIDLGITSYNIQNKNFSWKTNLVFSHFKNILNDLNSANVVLLGNANDFTGASSVVNVTQAGRPVGAFYGFVADGLYRNSSELSKGVLPVGLTVGQQGVWLGDVRYKDLNNDGKIASEDVTFIGDPNPKFTYGITNTFSFQGFDVSIFLQGVYGDQIFNWTRKYTEALNNPYTNQLLSVLNRFTASNPNGNLPRYNQWNNNNLVNSDRFIEDGSYLRIQNVSIGYNLPKALLNRIKVSSARIYISGQNLYTFTKYTGYDPEIGSYNKSVLSQNVDNGHYPNPRTITLGANIEL